MRRFGQGRPIRSRRLCARLIAAFAASGLMLAAVAASAAELDVRIRFTWRSGGQALYKWTGAVTVAGARLSRLQPLGTEADEAAALRLTNDGVVVAPLVGRAFDGFDVTVRGDESALVKIDLRQSPDSPAKTIEAPLGQVASEPFQAALDDLGGEVLIHRAPGDKLRVQIDRDHLVFDPGEPITLALKPDLAREAAEGEITIKAALVASGSDDALAELTRPYDPQSSETTSFEFTAPTAERAYRIKLAAVRRDGLASRLTPWAKGSVVAARDVEFVVIDPAARLPRLSTSWEVVSTIDPTNSSWWQRVPQWTQFDKLPAFATPRPLGNIRPKPAVDAPGLVELPVAGDRDSSAEQAWQGYLLPVRRVGEPHAVDIELPRGVRQHLGLSIVEPDAADRAMTFGRDCGVYSEQRLVQPADAATETYRLVFWPRTKSPALVLSNRSPSRPARCGKIRLLRRTTTPAPAGEDHRSEAVSRLVAAYISSPRFADSLGAGETPDPETGLSIEGWSHFLSAANRLAQQLQASGHNGLILTVAADGASLAPVEGLGVSPRFDGGASSSAAADPLRKDVLEALLRIFDREGLRLIPALQLSAPLPALESLTASTAEPATANGLRWVGRAGRTWQEHQPDGAFAPHYNLLAGQVQAEIAALADRLVARYGAHPSLGGLGIQLSSAGYATLPGMSWGFDDATMDRFAAEAQLALPAEGAGRFQQRAALLLGQYLPVWSQWRRTQLSDFYQRLAASVARDRPQLQLVLCTEDLFAGQVAGERLRQAVAGRSQLTEALDEIGLDVDRLSATSQLTLLRPRRLAAEESVDARAADQRLNSAVELDRRLANQPQAGELLFNVAETVRLPSFDAQSPFGADRTRFVVDSPSVPVGHEALQSLAATLTSRDFVTLVCGADTLPLADNEELAVAYRAFQELPPLGAEVRTERRQPVTLRVYRNDDSTTLCLINESHWPVEAELPVQCDADLLWRQLGVGASAPADGQRAAASGSLVRGSHRIVVSLPPFGIHARRYSSRTMQLGPLERRLPPAAEVEMVRRVQEIEARMSGLSILRPYPQLQNPQFELLDDSGQLRGWQPRIGRRGVVEATLDPAAAANASTTPAGDAGRSVHLHSEDALGVAVQSHMFPVPATGQIVVQAKIRGTLAPGAQLYAWVEFESGGALRQRYAALADESLEGRWRECEFAVDDLPLGAAANMRVQFHLTGSGEAWVDDVRLFDLRFADAQRVELSKRLLGAKSALEDGLLMDCQRLVDAYLPRRLVEHVPPPALAANVRETDAAREPAPADEPAKKGLAPRIRGIVPKILR